VNEAITAGFTRLQQVVGSGLLQYRDGGYAIGLEYVHFQTRVRGGAAAALQGEVKANQYFLTGNYYF
jgi:hypothetical protein